MLEMFPKGCDVCESLLCGLQVSLLVVMEIGLFPLICGWWLDLCSLVSQKLCEHHGTGSSQ